MVVEEGEMESESWVVQQGRQSSIYSLTLEEFQHSVCETGKNFGSMNMDEFLTSIWSAEDNNNNNNVPPPLCTKTVDEVWSQIQKQQHNNDNLLNNTDSAPRQPTFGEMTLEDFLVKAGVVREPPVVSHSTQQQHYGNVNVNVGMRPSFVGRQVMGNVNVVAPSYHHHVGNGKSDNGGYHCFGYGSLSPANSSDGVGNDHMRGRKRMVDGPVEKVVERRQRRMIKNRESAARSRARKQAYTVELEAELNQLREENAQLKQGLVELERRRRKQKCFAEVNVKVETKAQKAKEKLRALRRNMSCPL